MTVSPEEQLLFDKYRLNECTLTREQRTSLVETLLSIEEVFAKNDLDLGECRVAVHTIDTGDHPPINTPPHALPHHLREVHRQELDSLLELGIIEPSTSEWASPVVYVKKKDNTWRMCVDFRKLNEIARLCVYPLPRVNDIFTMMTGCKYFTTLDLAKGFWQIKIHPDSREKTAFNSVFGQYQFKRLPFGLSTAPGAFQNALNTVLAGINWVKCLVYLDDILIFSKTFEEHLETLVEVMKRLINANLKVKLKKCEFARTQCNYLGHVLNSQGISPLPEKVSAIRDMPYPVCTQEIETFLGKVGYYGRFIDHLATIAKPLFALKRKRVEWKFEQPEKDSFDLLKELLCSAPVLRHPDFSLPFIVTTDASGYGLGAVLSQEFPDGEHPIAYASTTLQDEHTRYAVIEREGLAMCWGIIHFEEYLLAAPFVAYTDHKPLLSLRTKDQANKRLQNYALKLQHFTFEIRYREGISNKVADALSRYPRYPVNICKGKRSKLTQVNQDDDGNWIEPVESSKPRRKSKKIDPQISALTFSPENRTVVTDMWENIKELQEADSDFAPILRSLKELDPLPLGVEKPSKRILDSFIVDNKGVLRKFFDKIPLICIPTPLRPSLMAMAHDADLSAHGGILKTYRRLIEQCWWPKMNTDVIEYIRNCPQCLAHKSPNKIPRAPMGTRSPPTHVFERLHMDIWSVGGNSYKGNNCVLAFVDAFSKFVIAVPLKEHTMKTCVKAFMEHVVVPFGLPHELVSDGAPEFRAFMQDRIFRSTGVVRKIITPYHPQSNGQIERFFRTLRPMLAIITRNRPRSWDTVLPMAIHAYNSSYNPSIGSSPFYLMYGRHPRGHLFDFGDPPENFDSNDESDVSEGEREISVKLAAARRWARHMILKQQQDGKDGYDRRAKEHHYAIGDLVYVRVERREGEVKKLVPKYSGPFTVVKVLDNVLYIVPQSAPQDPERQVHVDRVRPIKSRREPYVAVQQPNPTWQDPALFDEHLDPEID